MWYSFFWKFIEDSFKNVYVKLEPLLFARAIYTNVQIKEKSTPFWIRNKKYKKKIYIYIRKPLTPIFLVRSGNY